MASERATCETCKWWQPIRSDMVSGHIGECRIRSTPDMFPDRRASDWCGEHQPREVGNG